jgi:hypothetical protein
LKRWIAFSAGPSYATAERRRVSAGRRARQPQSPRGEATSAPHRRHSGSSRRRIFDRQPSQSHAPTRLHPPQPELLAADLRRMLALDAADGELVRTRSTPPQVGKDRRSRFENVRDAFAWRGSPLRGESILLIDDVTTTGATLNACAAALNGAGSGPVTGVSIARVNV